MCGALRLPEPIGTTSCDLTVPVALAEMIRKAGRQVGNRPPPQAAIAAALGAGRSTLREVPNRWQGTGLIRRRQGTVPVGPSRTTLRAATARDGAALGRSDPSPSRGPADDRKRHLAPRGRQRDPRPACRE